MKTYRQRAYWFGWRSFAAALVLMGGTSWMVGIEDKQWWHHLLAFVMGAIAGFLMDFDNYRSYREGYGDRD